MLTIHGLHAGWRSTVGGESGSDRRQGSQMLQRSWGKRGGGWAHACTAAGVEGAAARAGMAGTGAAWFRARTGNARAIGAPPAPGWLGLERAVRRARTPPAPGSPDCHPRRDGRERARGGDTRARGRAASVARERVREDSRPFTAQRVRHPLQPDRTVHIIFWLDLTVIGLAGDVALLGARGLIQESYIEIPF